MSDSVEQQLWDATQRILDSQSQKKLVIAGPGTGKTFLFRKLLETCPGSHDDRLVLTFINNLKDDLERSLGELASVYTLHAYCQRLLYRHAQLRDGLTSQFRCYPGLASLIKQDWQWLEGSQAPEFIKKMRDLECPDEQAGFYVRRANYYDAVDFDDSVYRTYCQLRDQPESIPDYELVLVDEFQDFNAMEAGIIDLLASRSSIVIAGDDDQALYSQLRGANWNYIRAHHQSGDFEVFELPFSMRCPKVVVGAVNDIIDRARAESRLDGRVDKPYRYFEPLKGEVSRLYPNIELVRTSVQRLNANYFGRYIEHAIRNISEADIEEATQNLEPLALVIGPKPYLPQIERHLVDAGLLLPANEQKTSLWDDGLSILSSDPESNLGWRLILACEEEEFAAECIQAANERGTPLLLVIPEEQRDAVLQEAAEMEASQAVEEEALDEAGGASSIKLTSYEGSKGLSSQHVFVAGLHSGDLPRDPDDIRDIEICRFLVGLTRTKKKCTLLLTRRFGQDLKNPSSFLEWIDESRYDVVNVDAAYWKRLAQSGPN